MQQNNCISIYKVKLYYIAGNTELIKFTYLIVLFCIVYVVQEGYKNNQMIFQLSSYSTYVYVLSKCW